MEFLDGWLHGRNLKGFLAALSDVVGYHFGNLDWDAVEAGLESGSDDGEWFTYPLVGRVEVEISISRTLEEGDCGVKVFLPAGEPCLREQVQVAWSIFNRFDVSPHVDLVD
ncbi:hypothetical protein AB0H28_00205 [Micromonospora sp. NPDC050980]|uniref:hypothetical protein n=1 Tax=Micromonospora sp. NPDC050980 TaxID=3155161 RepID=UPI0033C9AE91